MVNAKDALSSLTPRLLWDRARVLWRKARGLAVRTFEGPFSSWEAAVSRSYGWDSPDITDKTLNAALKVRDGLIEFEQDLVASKNIVYSTTILAFLLLLLSRDKGNINIIDFGGGLGNSYVQNRKILRQLVATSVRWNIVERPVFVKLGMVHFQTD